MSEASTESNKMTNARLAREAGVTPSAVGQWLSGKVESLKPENLYRAAKALGVSTDWLAAGVGPRSRKAVAQELDVSPRALRLAGLFDLMKVDPDYQGKVEREFNVLWEGFKESRARTEQSLELKETEE